MQSLTIFAKFPLFVHWAFSVSQGQNPEFVLQNPIFSQPKWKCIAPNYSCSNVMSITSLFYTVKK